eukprot:c19671_g1_i1.p1 GENE.c19671_g1_i1~~c19671_g1_i1.p1  ORF type:complete len:295 (+),score=50.57 c19671_g1_i1:472-1356(+)
MIPEVSKSQPPPQTLSCFFYAAIVTALVGVSILNSMFEVLWPIYLTKTLHWRTVQYAWILFVSSLVTTAAIACAPWAQRKIGVTTLVVGGLLIAGILSCVAFSLPIDENSSAWPVLCHVISSLILCACLAVSLPLLNAALSVSASARHQGRTFGGMTLFAGIGAQLGGIGGAYLFQNGERWGFGATQGASNLPFVVGGVWLCVGALATACAMRSGPKGRAQAVSLSMAMESSQKLREADGANEVDVEMQDVEEVTGHDTQTSSDESRPQVTSDVERPSERLLLRARGANLRTFD